MSHREENLVDTELRPIGSPQATLDYKVTGRRIVAALLDLIPLVVLLLVMAAAFGESGKTADEGDGNMYSVSLNGWPFVLYLLLALGYFVVFEGLAARTPGKFLMGLKVVKLDGGSYDWIAILVRNVLRIVDGLPVLYLVGLVTVAVTQRNQRLGDLAAGTLVVRAG
jgi:uncharacterized RDD family membrane protein YckC